MLLHVMAVSLSVTVEAYRVWDGLGECDGMGVAWKGMGTKTLFPSRLHQFHGGLARKKCMPSERASAPQ